MPLRRRRSSRRRTSHRTQPARSPRSTALGFLILAGVLILCCGVTTLVGHFAPSSDNPATLAAVATDTPYPTDTPLPPTWTPTPHPTCIPRAVNCNPWGYHLGGGKLIYSPPAEFCAYFTCIGSFWNGHGYIVECADGEYSLSGGRTGSCSLHGGEEQPLYA